MAIELLTLDRKKVNMHANQTSSMVSKEPSAVPILESNVGAEGRTSTNWERHPSVDFFWHEIGAWYSVAVGYKGAHTRIRRQKEPSQRTTAKREY
jgi:hypothetical protein